MIKTTKKLKNNRYIKKGIIHIKSTFNNTIITVTNLVGDTLFWMSAGRSGFKGTRKGGSFAAQRIAEQIAKEIKEIKIKIVRILVKGQGPGRDSAIRTFRLAKIKMKLIEDVTPIPHNGCRQPKKRRV